MADPDDRHGGDLATSARSAPVPVPPPVPPVEPDRSIGVGMLVALALVALAIAVAAVAWFLTHRTSSSPPPPRLFPAQRKLLDRLALPPDRTSQCPNSSGFPSRPRSPN